MSIPKPTVFLDLDGVCTDWHSAVGKLFTRSPEQIYGSAWKTGYWMHDWLNVSEEELWHQIDMRGAQWWASLAPYPYFAELYDGLREHTDLYFLSSPSGSAHAAAGKMHWMQMHAPEIGPRRLILTEHKHLLAAPNRFLIDDCQEHCQKFNLANLGKIGNATVFPAPWNHMYSHYPTRADVAGYAGNLVNRFQQGYHHAGKR